ncbi:hypothetical protein NBO_28g0031 [Nosema bombycis CQ1]|uniref:Uncharacterized protein n=1 Tax=Nosema bombycis (strain CQ1 / CVCC 102059) TaxID=578461 RepID=R0KW36_NOSB1|nr:hypothetical protein NBO_28g0031 [Nosema bombycis CQ1]|eukprot:EOB14392.1 hypothetical protein NBO_28g0031 [Nosema bombycis CQ1]
MDYTLCSSSSTEEGEISKKSLHFDSIPNSEFPRSFSILKNWYLPDSQILIGPNSIPRPSDYPKDLPRTRLKRRLRKDLPNLFNVISLNKDRNFFNNKFEKVSGNRDEGGSYDIHRIYDHHRVDNHNNTPPLLLPLIPTSSLSKSLYSSYCEIFSFDDKRHEVVKNVDLYPFCSKFILIRDSIIDKLNLENVFNFFRVIKSRKGVSYVFEDSFNRKIKFNEYLELYYEEVLRSKNSNEIRTYLCKGSSKGVEGGSSKGDRGKATKGKRENKDKGSSKDKGIDKDNKDMNIHTYPIFLAVYSSSTFIDNQSLLHYYNGLDSDKNFMIYFNKNEIDFKKIKNESKSKIDFILNLDLEEGDYAISKGEIYKVGIKGDKHEYEGLLLDEFE